MIGLPVKRRSDILCGMHGKQPHHSGRGWGYLWRMLSEYNQFPEHAGAIEAALRRAFEKQIAILAMDMAGFSRLTIQYGVLHYMAMIAQMVEAATPAVEGNGGVVIKQDADNLFARFATPADAVEAGLDIFRAFEAINAVTPPERHIRGSIGIGFGPTLVVEDQDMFGREMNHACKLGEDLAKAGEILLTPGAHAALPEGQYECVPVTFQVGEIELDAMRYVGKVFEEMEIED
jgi:adenylate cyclase